jgi:hypothetical protein
MAKVYSSAFLEAKELEGHQDFITNAGVVTVVRCIDVFHGFQGAPVSGRVVGPNFAAFFAFYSKVPLESLTHQWFGWRGRQVFGPEQMIRVTMDSGNADWRISGYELTNV